jgi:hypothetical protein
MMTASLLAACGGSGTSSGGKVEPAKLEPDADTGFNRVVLTDRAAQRLGIQTGQIHEELMNGVQQLVAPYAAVIYGLSGETWVYVAVGPNTFARELVHIDRIEGDSAFLSVGPAIGTEVVIVGVAQLYGADTGVGK